MVNQILIDVLENDIKKLEQELNALKGDVTNLKGNMGTEMSTNVRIRDNLRISINRRGDSIEKKALNVKIAAKRILEI